MIFDAIRRWMGSPPGGNGGDGRNGGSGGMSSCEDALSRLYEYLDGELDGVSHEEVEEHLRTARGAIPTSVSSSPSARRCTGRWTGSSRLRRS